MPLIETKGAASAQGFGGAGAGASGPVTYIEDVFSTWLYTGNGTTQTITNGIDLSGKGGLVWIKRRDTTQDHALIDTARANGASVGLATNSSSTGSAAAGGFLSTGFSVGNSALTNASNATFASWTFREQPKFFDIVTGTCDGSGNITVNHSLGSVPGFVTIKRTDGLSAWFSYHTSLGNNQYVYLNATNAAGTLAGVWNATSTTFTANAGFAAGAQVVLYLWASNAGGFGLSGTDNVISCGSYTGSNGAGQAINLGYEAQWVLIKNTSRAGQNWVLMDNMRSFDQTNYGWLYPNTSGAEATGSGAYVVPTATGFATTTNANAATDYLTDSYIYIAIRRGPMKTPTSGTSVFAPVTFSTSSGLNQTLGGNFNVDWALLVNAPVNNVHYNSTRLIGASRSLATATTNAESSTLTAIPTPTNNNAFSYLSGYFRIEGGNQTYWNGTGSGTNGLHLFARAPGFFDVVCYTGNGTTSRDVTHNLGVKPELVIVKSRSAATTNWVAGAYVNSSQFNLWLNSTVADGSASSGGIAYTQFSTASNFRLSATGGVVTDINTTSATYVAYLFATVGGVSKVGSYTGTGALQTINCGFTGGARFVLIKRTDSTGDWYVYDSARGISSGNDPYLFLNSTAAEVTGTNYVDTTSVGFQVTAAAPAGLNASGGTYIFLAIA